MSGAALAGCGSSKDDKPAADQPAGEAIEVAGSVTVVHEGAEQPLVLGAKVFGADEIVTGADGAVTIRLFHNEARWSLEADKRKRVDASLAWSAPKQAGGGVLASNDVDESTAAAGRHTEKEAADTRATAALVAPGAATDDEPAATGAELAAAPPTAAPPAPAPPAPAPPAAAAASAEPTRDMAPPPPPAPRRRGTSAAKKKSSSHDIDDLLEGGGGLSLKGGGGGGPKDGVAVEKAPATSAGAPETLTTAQVRDVMARNAERFRACHRRAPTASGKVVLKFAIETNGSVSGVKTSADSSVDPAIASCLVEALKKVKFPARASGNPMSISYPVLFKAE